MRHQWLQMQRHKQHIHFAQSRSGHFLSFHATRLALTQTEICRISFHISYCKLMRFLFNWLGVEVKYHRKFFGRMLSVRFDFQTDFYDPSSTIGRAPNISMIYKLTCWLPRITLSPIISLEILDLSRRLMRAYYKRYLDCFI